MKSIFEKLFTLLFWEFCKIPSWSLKTWEKLSILFQKFSALQKSGPFFQRSNSYHFVFNFPKRKPFSSSFKFEVTFKQNFLILQLLLAERYFPCDNKPISVWKISFLHFSLTILLKRGMHSWWKQKLESKLDSKWIISSLFQAYN
jgi:hypothetical protein